MFNIMVYHIGIKMIVKNYEMILNRCMKRNKMVRIISGNFIPLVLRKERYNVEVRPCEKSDIMEIDNFYELVQLDLSI